MSRLLLQVKRPSMDTSFMDGRSLRSKPGSQNTYAVSIKFYWLSDCLIFRIVLAVVVCRAFTTSQSAEAHRILFQRIFEIVEADTGKQVQFHHIHGTGWDTVIADEHRGQALGEE